MTDVHGAVDGQLTDPQLWVPIAEAARRQSPVVSRAAMHKRVTKLVDLGRLATRPGQRGAVLVNIVALNRAIAQETDPAQALRNNTPPAVLNLDDDEDDADGGSAAPPGARASSYHASRAEREAYQAENARLDLALRLDRLTDKDDVSRRTMTAMRKIRDRLLSLPATVSDRVSAAPDARAVRTILTAEIRAVLEALATELDRLDDEDADELDDDAAGGEPSEAAAQ